jgi:hypothetical protein
MALEKYIAELTKENNFSFKTNKTISMRWFFLLDNTFSL